MCRLLGWAARRPCTVADALGGAELAAFTSLSRQHADGWGMAWWPRGASSVDPPRVERSTTCAADDDRFAELTRSVPADAGIVHLRWATPGLPIIAANTHPFVHKSMAFAHNGAIHPLDRIGELVSPGWTSQLAGTTDSERYFVSIVARVSEGEMLPQAVGAVVRRIFEGFSPTSLNAMLLTPDALYVISAYDRSRVPMMRTSSGGASSSMEPDTTFYDLAYRADANSVVVASSGFPQPEAEGWQRLANMTLLRIDRGTLVTSTVTLTN
ncbi:MAG: class II glutamine amidotransferase [Candidatus Dormiibacterota bacterium]